MCPPVHVPKSALQLGVQPVRAVFLDAHCDCASEVRVHGHQEPRRRLAGGLVHSELATAGVGPDTSNKENTGVN